jgi:hypothetical protein
MRVVRIFWALLVAVGLLASQAGATLRACTCQSDCPKQCCPSAQKDACKVSFASADQPLSDAAAALSLTLWIAPVCAEPIVRSWLIWDRASAIEKAPPRIRAPEGRSHLLRAPPYLA